jgi:hypothetical protein
MFQNINRAIAIAVVCFAALQSHVLFGGGGGHAGSPSGAGHGSNAHAPALGSFAPYRPAGNGINSPGWAGGLGCYPGGVVYSGYGYGGYGYGGLGLEYPAWGWPYNMGYYTESTPYFSLFPPVYYSYDNGAIAPKSTLRSSWMGNDAGSGVAEASPAPAPEPQPLRIANPYYTEGKRVQ